MSRATEGQSTKDTSSDTRGCTTPEYKKEKKEDNEQGNCGAEYQGPAVTPGAAPHLSTRRRIMSRATVGQSTKDTSSDTRGCTTPE